MFSKWDFATSVTQGNFGRSYLMIPKIVASSHQNSMVQLHIISSTVGTLLEQIIYFSSLLLILVTHI